MTCGGKICGCLYVPDDVLGGELSLKSADLYGRKWDILHRHKAGFHSVWCAGIEEFSVGTMILYYGYNGESRIDMTCRSASCQ